MSYNMSETFATESILGNPRKVGYARHPPPVVGGFGVKSNPSATYITASSLGEDAGMVKEMSSAVVDDDGCDEEDGESAISHFMQAYRASSHQHEQQQLSLQQERVDSGIANTHCEEDNDGEEGEVEEVEEGEYYAHHQSYPRGSVYFEEYEYEEVDEDLGYDMDEDEEEAFEAELYHAAEIESQIRAAEEEREQLRAQLAEEREGLQATYNLLFALGQMTGQV